MKTMTNFRTSLHLGFKILESSLMWIFKKLFVLILQMTLISNIVTRKKWKTLLCVEESYVIWYYSDIRIEFVESDIHVYTFSIFTILKIIKCFHLVHWPLGFVRGNKQSLHSAFMQLEHFFCNLALLFLFTLDKLMRL